MGALPNVLTAYQPVTSPEVRQKFAKVWGEGMENLEKPGLTVGEMISEAGHGNIKGIYILGENPVLSDPDANHVVDSFNKLEFLVVQDIFLTETAQLADVVLPASCFAEKDGTFSNTERRVQRVRKAVEPPGDAKADWEIICLIAQALGYPMQYESPAEIMDEIADLSPSYGGINYERLEKGGLQWPCPSVDHPGTPVLHVGKFARGLGKFNGVDHVPPNELPDKDYPLLLNTGRRYWHYHTGTMTHRSSGIHEFYNVEYLEVNPIDAEKIGICDGDLVRVTSRRGTVRLVAEISDKVLAGMVFTSFHFPDVPINRVTNAVFDPISKIPEYKVCAVRVEKSEDDTELDNKLTKIS